MKRHEEIAALCRELNLVHCVGPFQAEAATHHLRYFRLHGIEGYRHEYTDVELQELSWHLAGGEAHYFMFNNISMFRDAVRFQKLLE